MMRSVRFAVLLLLFPLSTVGQELTHVPAAFLDVGVDAQSMGMAGAKVALSRDVAAVFWNPAALLSVRQQQVLFGITRQFGLVPYHVLAYAGRFWNHTIAIGAITAGDEVLRENTIMIASAQRVRGLLAVGVTLKIFQASFGNNSGGSWEFQNANRQVQGDALGVGFDVGLRGFLAGRMVWGVAIQNILSTVSYNANNQAGTARGGSESIPTRLRVGIGMMPSRFTLLELDVDKALHLDQRDRFRLGLEHMLFNMLTLRAGYAQNLDATFINRIISIGGGIALTLPRTDVDFGLDIAYRFTELQNFPHVGLRLGW